jgi:Cu/Ag efflux protein CusF
MKTVLASSLILFAVAVSPPVMAASDHASHVTMPAPASPEAAMTDGLVKKVDKPGGKLTVSHGPLPNGMPAMTMAFRVNDAVWFDRLKTGDRIRFAVDTVNGVMTIVRLEMLK